MQKLVCAILGSRVPVAPFPGTLGGFYPDLALCFLIWEGRPRKIQDETKMAPTELAQLPHV